MIIDMFTYYNETELLDFHINHVSKYVDKIIVVEGDRTYDGRPYASTVQFSNPKVEHHIVPLNPNPSSRWENEAIQRRLAGEIAKRYTGSLYFECADEIIHPAHYLDRTEPVCLSLDNYYYYFNGRDVGEKPDHPMPIAIPIDQITDLHQQWEHRHGFRTINKSGWHFSYLGGVERIKQKLAAYSHAENDVPEIKDSLEYNIAKGKDIFYRPDHRFEYVPIDDTFPKELIDNQDKYKELIHEA